MIVEGGLCVPPEVCREGSPENKRVVLVGDSIPNHINRKWESQFIEGSLTRP